MRPLAGILGAAALLLAVASTACSTAQRRPVVGQKAPDTTFSLFDGGELRIDSMKGDVVVLAFFTTWCPTSAATLKAVNELRARTIGLGITIIAVNEGDSAVEVERFLKKTSAYVTVGFDKQGALANEMGLLTVPSVVVIDRRGDVRHVHSGYHGEDDRTALGREVAELLLEDAPAALVADR